MPRRVMQCKQVVSVFDFVAKKTTNTYKLLHQIKLSWVAFLTTFGLVTHKVGVPMDMKN